MSPVWGLPITTAIVVTEKRLFAPPKGTWGVLTPQTPYRANRSPWVLCGAAPVSQPQCISPPHPQCIFLGWFQEKAAEKCAGRWQVPRYHPCSWGCWRCSRCCAATAGGSCGFQSCSRAASSPPAPTGAPGGTHLQGGMESLEPPQCSRWPQNTAPNPKMQVMAPKRSLPPQNKAHSPKTHLVLLRLHQQLVLRLLQLLSRVIAVHGQQAVPQALRPGVGMGLSRDGVQNRGFMAWGSSSHSPSLLLDVHHLYGEQDGCERDAGMGMGGGWGMGWNWGWS